MFNPIENPYLSLERILKNKFFNITGCNNESIIGNYIHQKSNIFALCSLFAEVKVLNIKLPLWFIINEVQQQKLNILLSSKSDSFSKIVDNNPLLNIEIPEEFTQHPFGENTAEIEYAYHELKLQQNTLQRSSSKWISDGCVFFKVDSILKYCQKNTSQETARRMIETNTTT